MHVCFSKIILPMIIALSIDLMEYSYTRLVPYGYELEPAHPPTDLNLNPENWQELLGKKVDYTALLSFFDEQDKELGTEEVVKRYAPVLIAGSAGALTHGIIHLGWALSVPNRWMTIEGAA
jgi:hypothetical protein